MGFPPCARLWRLRRSTESYAGHAVEIDEKKRTTELFIRQMTANIRVALNRHAKELYSTVQKNSKDSPRQHFESVENPSILDTTMAKGFGNGDGKAVPATGETSNAGSGCTDAGAHGENKTKVDITIDQSSVSETKN